MIYNIKDKLPTNKLILFSIQMMLSVFTATVLIANICGVNVSAALVGAGLATIIYEVITGFNSPMYISNSGAFVAPTLAALAAGGYTGVAIGGLVSFMVYGAFGAIFTKFEPETIYKFLPKPLIGGVTMVIGTSLMGFIPTYVGDTAAGFYIAIATAIVILLVAHYSKGTLGLFPFLIGILFGYVISIPFGLVDLSIFSGMHLFTMPEFAFTKWADINKSAILNIVILYVAYTVTAICECLSDHKVLSNIIGTDLYKNPGLGKIFIGEGWANIMTSMVGGLGACSYGESIATIGFSKNAAVRSTFGAAVLMVLMGFIEPVQLFIQSIPTCVIAGGTALILYGYIAVSGLRTMGAQIEGKWNNLLPFILSVGISGISMSISLGSAGFAISGTALALIFGVVLNLILK